MCAEISAWRHVWYTATCAPGLPCCFRLAHLPCHLCDGDFPWCPLTQIHMKSNGPVSTSLPGRVNGSEWPESLLHRGAWGWSLVLVGAQNTTAWDVGGTFFFSFAWMCTRGPGFKSACNLGFVLKADVKVWGLFCIGRVFGSIKGLTVISEVAKGDPASVIILFTSIMELNIEEVIAGSRCTTTTTTTTIASTQRGSSLIPPPFWGPQRDTDCREERPWLRDLLRVGGLEITNMFGHNSINPISLFFRCLLICLFFRFSMLAQTRTLVCVISI